MGLCPTRRERRPANPRSHHRWIGFALGVAVRGQRLDECLHRFTLAKVHHNARIGPTAGQIDGNARQIQQHGRGAHHQNGFGVAVLVGDEVHRLPLGGEFAHTVGTVGQHQAVEQKTGFVLERRIGLQRHTVGGFNGADVGTDKARAGACSEQRGMHIERRLTDDARRHKNGHLAWL